MHLSLRVGISTVVARPLRSAAILGELLIMSDEPACAEATAAAARKILASIFVKPASELCSLGSWSVTDLIESECARCRILN